MKEFFTRESSPDALRKPESLVTPEDIAAFIEGHEPAVRRLVQVAYAAAIQQSSNYEDRVEGVWQSLPDTDLRWRLKPTYRRGKQQVVTIVECQAPGLASFECVLKRDVDGMHKKQTEQPLLKRLLPRIYLEEGGVAMVEKIDGLELEPYQDFIKDESHFRELVRAAVEILEEVSRSSFVLQDADFMDGHNVMFDTRASRFRLFDIHTFSHGVQLPGEKICSFLNNMLACHGGLTRERARFVEVFLQDYLGRHPDEEGLEFKGDAYRILQDGTEEYEHHLQEIYESSPRNRLTGWRGSITLVDHGIVGLRSDIRLACLQKQDGAVFNLLQDPVHGKTRTPLLEFKRKAV